MLLVDGRTPSWRTRPQALLLATPAGEHRTGVAPEARRAGWRQLAQRGSKASTPLRLGADQAEVLPRFARPARQQRHQRWCSSTTPRRRRAARRIADPGARWALFPPASPTRSAIRWRRSATRAAARGIAATSRRRPPPAEIVTSSASAPTASSRACPLLARTINPEARPGPVVLPGFATEFRETIASRAPATDVRGRRRPRRRGCSIPRTCSRCWNLVQNALHHGRPPGNRHRHRAPAPDERGNPVVDVTDRGPASRKGRRAAVPAVLHHLRRTARARPVHRPRAVRGQWQRLEYVARGRRPPAAASASPSPATNLLLHRWRRGIRAEDCLVPTMAESPSLRP